MPAAVAAAAATATAAATVAGTGAARDRHRGSAARVHDATGNVAAAMTATVHDLAPASAVDLGFNFAAVAAGTDARAGGGDDSRGAAALAMNQFASAALVHLDFGSVLGTHAAGAPAGCIHDAAATTAVDQFSAPAAVDGFSPATAVDEFSPATAVNEFSPATFVRFHFHLSRQRHARAKSKGRR